MSMLLESIGVIYVHLVTAFWCGSITRALPFYADSAVTHSTSPGLTAAQSSEERQRLSNFE